MSKSMHALVAALVATLASTTLAVPAEAQSADQASVSAYRRNWKLEITPYLWAMGVSADVTAGNQKVRVDKNFSDIFKVIDLGGSALAVAQLNRFVVLAQLDYASMDTDKLDSPPAHGRFQSDSLISTLGVGWQFGRPGGATYDVLIGARNLSLDNTLTLDGIGRFKGKRDFTDPLLIVRPSWPLGRRWRFNPTLAYGTGGDSVRTWDLQPQVQFQITDRLAARFGYRRLYSDVKSERGIARFDGAFHGLILGIGGTFGG